jgi:hypothetical protein
MMNPIEVGMHRDFAARTERLGLTETDKRIRDHQILRQADLMESLR